MSSGRDAANRTMWLAVVASILISIGILLYVYLTWNFNYWKDRGVPGPRPKPFLGTFSSGFTQKEHQLEENNRIYNQYKNEANFVGGFSFRSPQLFILSSKLARDILLKFHKHFQANDVSIDVSADPLLASHPFFLQGEDWRKQRAQVTPAFTSNRLKSLLPLMDNVCSNMVDHIDREANLGPIESKELATKYTTDVVASCIFGTEGGSLTAEKSEIREISKALLNQTFMFVVIAVVQSIAPFIRRFVKLNLIPKRIEDFFVGLMAEAVRTRKASGTRHSDYLDYLIGLQEKKEISVLDMAAHGVTFFIDGFETTSEVLAFALFEIAMNRDVQKRLRQDILETENREGSLLFETIMEMPFLDQVVNETLRKWPPAFVLSKVCTEDIKLELANGKSVLIERDISAILPIWAIQLDEQHFPNPERFDPGRFSEAEGGHSAKYYQERGIFLPFGDGPRACIGRRIGLLQVKRAIVEIVKNYEITINSKTILPLRIDPKQFVIAPLGGIWIDYKKN